MANPIMPKYVRNILEKLERHGHQAFVTGGCVRDLHMGKNPHDWDISTSAKCDEVRKLFVKTITVGEKFGTVIVLIGKSKAEVTTFRREESYTDFRHPKHVVFVTDLNIDLARRDFTMNAMAMSLSGDTYDPMGGIADIKNRIIRCVGDPEKRFAEDALRMMRAFRFSATLNFTIEPKVLEAINQSAYLAEELSAERMREETEKILMSKKPEVLGSAINYGLFGKYLIQNSVQSEKFIPIGKLPKNRTLRWCAFCAVLEKGAYIVSTTEFLKNMRMDRKTIGHCKDGVLLVQENLPAEETELKRLLSVYGEDAIRCTTAAADVLFGGSQMKIVNSLIKRGECVSVRCLAVNGDDLVQIGYQKGRELGRTLDKLLQHVIENPRDNNRKMLLQMAKDLLKLQ